MVLHCIAHVVGIKRSVCGRDFVTQWAVTNHLEPERALGFYGGYEGFSTFSQTLAGST